MFGLDASDKSENKQNTSKNYNALKLPAVCTKFAKKSTYFVAAKMYNCLSQNITTRKFF